MPRLIASLIAAAGLGLSAAGYAQMPTPPASAGLEKAVFAGGCFWCMEQPFDKIDGVKSTTSGYVGGGKVNPTYHEVSSGTTGHTEAVEIVYDPKKVKFETLLDTFWRNIDPTDRNGQFCDRGAHYRPGIFYQNDEQKRLSDLSKAALDKQRPFKAPIAIEITKGSTFYAAEDYHQDYYKKNPVRYKFYRSGCGRDARLAELWGKAPEH